MEYLKFFRDKRNRGHGGQIIVLEEASSIRGGNIGATIAPMLGVDKTVLFCISTPGYGDNLYNKMALMKDTNGAPLFQLEMVHQACNRCQSVGRSSLCRHLEILLPAWKDPKAGELQKAMMDKNVYETEALGLINTLVSPVFDSAMIDYWLIHQQAVFEQGRAPRFIFVSIDPARGSMQKSELAMIAGVRTTGNGFMVVGGHASFTRKADEDRELIIEFISRLRGNWPDAHLIMMPENTGDPKHAYAVEEYWDPRNVDQHRRLEENRFVRFNPLGGGAGTIYTAHMSKSTPELPGVNTTHAEKITYAIVADTQLRNKKFYMLTREHFVTCHDRAPALPVNINGEPQGEQRQQHTSSECSPQAYKEIMDKIGQQMRDYSKEYKKFQNPDQRIHQTQKFTLSGKRWGPDDMAMCVQMCNRWSMHFACGNDMHFNQHFGETAVKQCETAIRMLAPPMA